MTVLQRLRIFASKSSFIPSYKRLLWIRAQPWDLSSSLNGQILPAGQIVDEEICPDYDSTNYYPASPRDIFHDRYQVLTKLGWGKCSTVWLARDTKRFKWQDERFSTLKIGNCKSGPALEARHERDIEQHIAAKNPASAGYRFIRTHIDSFEVTGPYGKHLCLVYEPLREPLWMLRMRLEGDRLPLLLIKNYTYLLLAALYYLHSECRVVHTDLKLDNIMVTLEDQNVIKEFVDQYLDLPMQQKKDSSGRTVYLSHNNLGPLKPSRKFLPKIVDFGLSKRLEPGELGHHPIQPDYFRAPEVILGCGWTYSADIWNLRVLMWNLVENKELFQHTKDDKGEYSPQHHIAEMIALHGPPPQELLRLSEENSQTPWAEPGHDSRGTSYRTAREYFGGPYFDAEGKFLHDDLIPQRKLEATLPSLGEEDRKEFISFIKRMLAWLPAERSTPLELLKDPFLDLQRMVKHSANV